MREANSVSPKNAPYHREHQSVISGQASKLLNQFHESRPDRTVLFSSHRSFTLLFAPHRFAPLKVFDGQWLDASSQKKVSPPPAISCDSDMPDSRISP